MRKLARGLVLTVVALVTLVPIQTGSALALNGVLDVEPESVSRVTGSTHTLTATLTGVTPPEGQVINFEWTPDTDAEATCTTIATGACSVEMTSTTPTSSPRLIRAYHVDGSTTPCTGTGAPPLPTADCDEDEPLAEDGDMDDTDAVNVEWLDATLDVEPEETTTGPSTEVSVTATVMSKGSTPKALVANVDAEVTSGPNDTAPSGAVPDSECDTDPATGQCALKYTPSSTTGVDELDAWIDRNDDPGPPPDGDTASGDETSGTGFEGDASEGPDSGTPAGAGTTAEPDETDVIKVNISASQVLTLLPASATKVPGTQSALTAKVTTGQTPQSGIKVAGAVLPGGANPTATATCTTGPNGECALNYTGANAGIDKFRATIDSDSNNLPNEADSSEDVGVPGGTAEPDTTAVSQITWAAATPPPPPPGGGGTQNQCDSSRATAGKNEILIGSKANDKICGFGGKDTLRGLAGNDRLNGGKGKDTAKGGKGKDRCKAEIEAKSCES